jgi:hypothetical protein
MVWMAFSLHGYAAPAEAVFVQQAASSWQIVT